MKQMNGDYWSGIAQDEYEFRLVEEARDFVSGERQIEITHEHVRVLLNWLDGYQYEQPARPF
ncbi:hypothetical protein [Thiolapillus sp.]